MPDLYARPSDGRYFCPFTLDYDPLKKLFLINFRNGTYYKAIEPQWFDDPINGTGLLVILYRLDGLIDVYYDPALTIDHRDFNIEQGLGEKIPTHFDRAHFGDTPAGIDLDIAFHDKDGHLIEACIKETVVKPRQPSSLLAPAGSAIEAPSFLPLFMMYDFYFVRRKGTEVRIAVDGEPRSLLPMPLPMGGERVYSLRYPGEPLIISLNPAGERPMTAIQTNGAGDIEDGHLRYRFTTRDEHPELARIAVDNGRHEVAFSFDPPVPDVACLREGAAVEGRFTMASDPEAGTLGGEYTVRRVGENVTVTFCASDGWMPNEAKLSARLIFNLLPMFKQWPKSYHWIGQVALGAGDPVLESHWERR